MNNIHFQNIWKEALRGTFCDYVVDINGKKYCYDYSFKREITLRLSDWPLYNMLFVGISICSFVFLTNLMDFYVKLIVFPIILFATRYFVFVWYMKKDQSIFIPKPIPYDDSYRRL